MTKIGTFQVERIFEITGRGLVLAGDILDGLVGAGYHIECTIEGEEYTRKIKSVEMISHTEPGKYSVGLLIGGAKDGIYQWKNKDLNAVKASVYVERLKLSIVSDWLASKSTEEKALFTELLLEDMIILNRAIMSDDAYTKEVILEAIKWSNELSHQLWNAHFQLKKGNADEAEAMIINQINDHAKQSKALAAHLSAIIESCMKRYYRIKTKR
jgi:hypothetical protein